jgi:hypothetical protein
MKASVRVCVHLVRTVINICRSKKYFEQLAVREIILYPLHCPARLKVLD